MVDFPTTQDATAMVLIALYILACDEDIKLSSSLPPKLDQSGEEDPKVVVVSRRALESASDPPGVEHRDVDIGGRPLTSTTIGR